MKAIIPNTINTGLFDNITWQATKDGNLTRPVNTEIITHQPLGKVKMSALIPALKVIAADWGLKLSRSHDRLVAIRILKNSVIKN